MKKIAVLLVWAATAAGCGGDDEDKDSGADKPATSATTPGQNGVQTEAETTEAPPEEAPAAKKAGVGDSITLQGTDSSEKVAVTVSKVLEDFQAGEFQEPKEGSRFIGIRLTMKNVGSARINDEPSTGAKLITTADEPIDSAIMVGGDCPSSDVNIAPGDTRNVCVPFEVKKGKKLKTFQLTMASGFSDDTGEWSLR